MQKEGMWDMSGTCSLYPNTSIALNDNNDDGDDDVDGNSNFDMRWGLLYIGIVLGSLHPLSELMLTNEETEPPTEVIYLLKVTQQWSSRLVWNLGLQTLTS